MEVLGMRRIESSGMKAHAAGYVGIILSCVFVYLSALWLLIDRPNEALTRGEHSNDTGASMKMFAVLWPLAVGVTLVTGCFASHGCFFLKKRGFSVLSLVSLAVEVILIVGFIYSLVYMSTMMLACGLVDEKTLAPVHQNDTITPSMINNVCAERRLAWSEDPVEKTTVANRNSAGNTHTGCLVACLNQRSSELILISKRDTDCVERIERAREYGSRHRDNCEQRCTERHYHSDAAIQVASTAEVNTTIGPPPDVVFIVFYVSVGLGTAMLVLSILSRVIELLSGCCNDDGYDRMVNEQDDGQSIEDIEMDANVYNN
jgi:hypothetical protein